MSENLQHAIDNGLLVNGSGETHNAYGNRHSEHTKSQMAAAKQGVKHPKFKGLYCTPAGRFASPPEAGRANNTNPKNVYRWCKAGKNGYSFADGETVL